VPASGPTFPRRRLGHRLEALRVAAGVTTQQVETAGVASKPTLWRIETGRQRVPVATVTALCRLYGASEPERRGLEQLAGQTGARGLWHEYRETAPSWFHLYIDLEAVTRRVFCFDDSVVPGELQTRAYAWALWRDARPELSDAEIAPHVDLRLRRQRALLGRVPPPRLDVVVGEGVLRRAVGGPEVLADQIRHLRILTQREHVSIRFLPFTAGGHPAVTGSFRLLEFPDADDPDVIYVELEVGSHYLEKPEELATYRRISATLAARAVPIGDYAP
jgi:transcriptional regulator with XRE-family HTH domain